MQIRRWGSVGVASMMAVWWIFAGSSARAGDWKTTAYAISKTTISLQLPQKDSADFSVYRARTQVDVNDPLAYEGSSSILVDQKYWDYFRFPKFGPVGTLQYQFLVRMVPKDQGFDPKDLDAVGKAAMAQRVQGWEQVRSETGEKRGKSGVPAIASDFGVVKIGDMSWFSYRTIRSSPTHCYVFGLDDTHYVELAFTYINNSLDEMENWKEGAEKDVEKILELVRVSQ